MNTKQLTHPLAQGLRLLSVATLIAGLALSVGPTQVAHAATFDVTRFDDPTPDGCVVGDCSLREAIIAANSMDGSDTIILPTGGYNLMIPPADPDTPEAGDLDITGVLTIEGRGASTPVIQGIPGDPVLEIQAGAAVEIIGVDIGKGSEGGIVIQEGASLTLNNSQVSANSVGGILNSGTLTVLSNSTINDNPVGISNTGTGTVEVSNSTITENRRGIENQSGMVTVTNSIITSNVGGSGIFNNGGVLKVFNSTISSNTASGKVFNSTISGNEAAGKGGGIFNSDSGNVTIENSTIASNSVARLEEEGGIILGEGGGIFNGGVLKVFNSTISGNEAFTGGGIFSDGGIVELNDTTVSVNSTLGRGGGIHASGQMTITHSSIIFNEARGAGAGIHLMGPPKLIVNSTLFGNVGFAVWFEGASGTFQNVTITGNSRGINASGEVRLRNTILALNGAPGSSNCVSSTDFISEGNNLFGDIDDDPIKGSCPRFQRHSADIICNDPDKILDATCPKGDPGLGAFVDDGTPGGGHVPLRMGSLAIDNGNPAQPGSGGNACEATDQLGTPRPRGLACDIGAFESPFSKSATVLADFSRPVRDTFSGTLRCYQSVNQQLDVVCDGPIYYKFGNVAAVQSVFVAGADAAQAKADGTTVSGFGVDLSAFITFVKVDPDGLHQSLLLKVQENSRGQATWRRGAIAVFYNATEGKVGIETFVPRRGWTTLATFPIILQDGDQLGGRALADGTVEAYVNGQWIGEANAGDFFVGKGGRIGLWFIAADDAVLDDFGGGSLP